MELALVGFCVLAASPVLLGWLYFRGYAITRPPIGVFNATDVAILIVAIILLPYLYLALPLWLVAVLLSASALSALSFTAEPILRNRWQTWLVALVLVGADVGTALQLGAMSPWFLAVNNVVLVALVVGVSNIWAQSGMKARDAAALAGILAVYDFIATGQLPLTTDLIQRLATIPFAPVLAFPARADGRWLVIGLGDLLLATVFPLVLRKAFGRRAGLGALAVSLTVFAVLLVLGDRGILTGTFPTMTVLGPLMVVQYGYWRHRRGAERTTWQYQQAEPVGGETPKPARCVEFSPQREYDEVLAHVGRQEPG
jgi:hypothetical protein